MKHLLPLLLLSFTASLLLPNSGGLLPRTIFSDDFSGTEFGKRWGHYKSGSVVKDGVLVGIYAGGVDHPRWSRCASTRSGISRYR